MNSSLTGVIIRKTRIPSIELTLILAARVQCVNRNVAQWEYVVKRRGKGHRGRLDDFGQLLADGFSNAYTDRNLRNRSNPLSGD